MEGDRLYSLDIGGVIRGTYPKLSRERYIAVD